MYKRQKKEGRVLKNKNFKELNDVDKVEEYIKKNCAYGCRWFMISEIKNSIGRAHV